MKKITALAALVASLVVSSAFAEDSYIYWLVDSSADGFTWNYAELFAQNGDTVESIDVWGTPSTTMSKTAGDYVTSTVTGYTGDGWSYYIELINNSVSTGDAIAKSRISQTYADLVSSGAIRAQADPKAISPVTFSSFQAVPEPSTGVMLLVGLALVGLKRKRA